MDTAQIKKQILQNTEDMPADILLKVLDFIGFLKNKYHIKSNTDRLREKLYELDNCELDHLEEEFENYQKLYPRE